MSQNFVLTSMALSAAIAAGIPWLAAQAAPLPPTISNFAPHKGAVNTTVVIQGTNFVPPLSIIFAGNSAASGSFSSTKITAIVPAGATNGPIQVNAAGGSASTAKPFRVTKKQAAIGNSSPIAVLAGPIAGHAAR